MAWFLNHYKCAKCQRRWSGEWSCTCDDDCPHCGARHMSPYNSEDLTLVVEQEGSEFVVLESPDTAEHAPDYRVLGRFATEQKAQAFIESDES